MTELSFHEDDYCQIELLPAESESFCLSEVKAIAAFSERHGAPEGIGWTDIYVRKENSIPLSRLGILLSGLRTTLSSIAPEADAVYTGYSRARMKCKQTVAFGTSNELVLFADFDAAGTVEHIWLVLDVRTETQIQTALNMFRVLAEKVSLILVDWGWCFVSKLNEPSALDTYLRQRVEVFSKTVPPQNVWPWWQQWKR